MYVSTCSSHLTCSDSQIKVLISLAKRGGGGFESNSQYNNGVECEKRWKFSVNHEREIESFAYLLRFFVKQLLTPIVFTCSYIYANVCGCRLLP